MLDLFDRTYVAVFRRYPMLARMALVVLLGEIVLAAVNNYGLVRYVTYDLHLPMRVVGVLISTFLAAEMLLKLPCGHLSDRHGRRHFAAIGVAACASTPLALTVIPTSVFLALPALVYLALLPLRVLDGAGSAALWPPLFASVPDHVPSEHRGVAMSVMNTAYMAGLALGPALAGSAIKIIRAAGRPEWADKGPFVLAAGAALLASLVAWTLPAQRSSGEPLPSDGRAVLPPWRAAFVIVVITFCDMFATATLAPYIAPYVSVVGRVEWSNVGFLILLLAVPAAVLGMPIGHLTDRWPKRQIVQGALVTTALGLWAVPLAHTLWQMLAAGVVVTLGFMFGLPAWLALIADLAPAGCCGKTMGLMATAQGFGAFLGPVIGGLLWDRIGVRAPFSAAAALLTLSACIALVCLRAPGAGELKGGS